MRCLAVDPGNDTGWALFETAPSGTTLVDCGLWRGYPEVTMKVDRVLIEMPQFYRASLSKGDPNDLAKVCVGVGKYWARLEDQGAVVATVFPAVWKRQIPKHVHHPRILGKLSQVEQEIVHKVGLKVGAAVHNTMDAIGLGQYAIAAGLWYKG